jgi:hypothetical protein
VGFLNITLTNIDVPRALAGSTIPNGINPQGDIVGSCRDSTNNFHSFLLSKGRFTVIDVPAAFGIQPSFHNHRYGYERDQSARRHRRHLL